MLNEKPTFLIRLVTFSPFIVMLTFLPSLSDPFNFPKLYILLVLAISGFVAFVFTPKVYFRVNRLTQILTILYVLFVLSVLISGLISEPNYIRSLLGSLSRNNGILYYVGVSVLSILSLRISSEKSTLRYFVKYMHMSAFILVFYSVLQYLDRDFFEWSNPYNRIIGTFGNPNFSASALGVFAIVYLFSFWYQLQVEKKNVALASTYFVLFLISSFLSWSTASLQGLILILVGISIFIIKLVRDRFNRLTYFSLAGSLVSVGIFVFISFIGLGPLGDTLRQYTLNLRLYYASIGFKGMLEKPITGEGADRYLEAFLRLRDSTFVSEYGITTVTDNAHSVPVQIGASYGIVALLLYLTLFMVINFYAIKIVLEKGSANSENRLVSIFVILMSIQSLFSIEQIGLGAPLWILGAAVVGSHAHRTNFKSTSKEISSSVKLHFSSLMNREFVAIVIVLLMLPLLSIYREDQAWKKIVYLQYSNTEDGTFVANQYNLLSDFTLSEPKKAGRLLENLYNSGDLETVQKLVDKLYVENPEDAYVHEVFAAELISKGDLRGAIQEYSQALMLDPVNWRTWLKKGRLELDVGDNPQAIRSLTKVVELGPTSEEARLARELLSNL